MGVAGSLSVNFQTGPLARWPESRLEPSLDRNPLGARLPLE